MIFNLYKNSNTYIWTSSLENDACKCFKTNQEVCICWFDIKARGLFQLGVKVCVWVGVGVQMRAQVQKKKKKREVGEDEQRMYSAVIHKVESTTKLFATV